MINIHHATAKKAEANGITLTANELIATATIDGKSYTNVDPKVALAAAMTQKMFSLEYPALELVQTDDDFVVQHEGDDIVAIEPAGGYIIQAGDFKELLADALETCQELEIDPTEGYDEDEGVPTVVHPKYKRQYREAGHPDHCGDWIASTLEFEFEDDDGNFDADDFTQFLILNGVEMTGKWASLPNSGQRGWKGRYRMNGRQKLEFQIAKTGKLFLRNVEHTVPESVLAELRAKHPKAYVLVLDTDEDNK